jgi:phosphatidylinositol-3,4,5-trisphosphate 3-phosphatase/dual-specificity protein phosphatase PTEN
MDILRKIVASPRARHPEAGLDLCYVTDKIVATSGPSGTYPQIAYRNPLKDLVAFLDSKHSEEWAIWEFRAEGTGYPDEEVYNRIRHYPWPDHHPPPFALVPLIMASMRDWLHAKENRVAVVHCKAGKGRSGTVTCSYLISEEGWTAADAMQRFTERRMRPGFGTGISIPSQVRWIGYVDRWTKGGKLYVDRPVEVTEVHVWGLRDGVKIAIEGFVDEGKVIKSFHTFKKEEREIVRGDITKGSGFADVAMEVMGKRKTGDLENDEQIKEAGKIEKRNTDIPEGTQGDVVFRPSSRIILPTSDINIDTERRNKTKYGGFTMVTAVAHVWFNTFFEGNGPEQNGKPDDSGVFEIEFDAMDGIKGSSRKGTRAFDKIAVVWKAVSPEAGSQPDVVITEPKPGETIPQARPANWKSGNDGKSDDFEKKLGLRAATAESAPISRASSTRSNNTDAEKKSVDVMEGVQTFTSDGKVLHTTPGVEREKNSEHTGVFNSTHESLQSTSSAAAGPGIADGPTQAASATLSDDELQRVLKEHREQPKNVTGSS